MQISGTDLNGNSATKREVRFPITSVTNDSGFRVSSARLKINFPLDAFGKSVDSLAILPPGEIDEKSLAQNIRRSFSRLNVSVNTELTRCVILKGLFLLSVQLQKSAGVQLRLQEPLGDKQGIFLESADGLHWLTGPGSGIRNFTIDRFVALAVYEDLVAPKIELDDSLEFGGLESRSPKLKFKR